MVFSAKAQSLAPVGIALAPGDSIYVSPTDGSTPVAGVPRVWFQGAWRQIAQAYVNTAPSGRFAVWERVYEDSLRVDQVTTSVVDGQVKFNLSREDLLAHKVVIDWGDRRFGNYVTPSSVEHWYAKQGVYEALFMSGVDGQIVPVEITVPQPSYEHHLVLTQVDSDPLKWHIEVIVPSKVDDATATVSITINNVVVNAAVLLRHGVGAIEHTFSAGTHGAQKVQVTWPTMITPCDGTITIAAAGPVIDKINPPTGWNGGTVVLTGVNFTGATVVGFGTVAATSFVVDSDTQITAVLPAHSAGKVDVTVFVNGVTATLTNGFEFVSIAKRTFRQSVEPSNPAGSFGFDTPDTTEPDGSVWCAVYSENGESLLQVFVANSGLWMPLTRSGGTSTLGHHSASVMKCVSFNFPGGSHSVNGGFLGEYAVVADGALLRLDLNPVEGLSNDSLTFGWPAGIDNTKIIGFTMLDPATGAKNVYRQETP